MAVHVARARSGTTASMIAPAIIGSVAGFMLSVFMNASCGSDDDGAKMNIMYSNYERSLEEVEEKEHHEEDTEEEEEEFEVRDMLAHVQHHHHHQVSPTIVTQIYLEI